jgi:hypothetical protein
MKEKIKKDINDFLGNTLELDLNLLKKNVDKILLKYYNNKDIYGYNVVCDNTNNYPYFRAKFIVIDVYLEEQKSQFIAIKFQISTDKLKILRKLRKKKLEKLYDIR